MTKAQRSRFAAWQRKIHNLPAIPGEEYFTCRELANRLRFNIKTIYRHIKAGKLNAYKVGNSFRITRTDFYDFVDKVKSK